MSQNTPANDTDVETIRISFLLDIRRYPELAYLASMDGRGDRPRELTKLALAGVRYQAETEALLRVTREAGVNANGLSQVLSGSKLPTAQWDSEPPVKPARTPQPVGGEAEDTSGAPEAAPEPEGTTTQAGEAKQKSAGQDVEGQQSQAEAAPAAHPSAPAAADTSKQEKPAPKGQAPGNPGAAKSLTNMLA